MLSLSVVSLILIASRFRNSIAQPDASSPASYFADCLTSWEVRRNASCSGSDPQMDLVTPESCLESCGSKADCTAAEVDHNDDTALCSHHSQTDLADCRVRTEGVVHFRRRRQCLQLAIDPNAAAGSGLLDFLNQLQGTTDRKVPTCNDVVDIAFVVDVSASIEEFGVNAGYFNLYVKVFLVSYVRYLSVGPDKIRVGMVVFDETARLIFPLTSNATDITSRINAVVYGSDGSNGESDYGADYPAGPVTVKQKRISSGLELVREQVLSPGLPMYRERAVHMAVLLTDGRSVGSDREATMAAATALKKQGVFVQVVGVTPRVELDELGQIASPVAEFNADEMQTALGNGSYGFAGAVSYFRTVEYLTQGLDELVDHQANTICPRQKRPIVCNDYADVVLLIDMSPNIETRSPFPRYFDRFLGAFLLRFVRLLNIRPGRIQISAVSYADSGRLVFPLTSDFNEVYRQLSNLTYGDADAATTGSSRGKNLSDALHVVRTSVLNVDAPKHRHDALNMVVVFGDGVRTSTTPSARTQALELQLQGVLIITVPVTPGSEQMELELVASPSPDLNRPGSSESVGSGFVQMSPGAVVPSEVEAATIVNKVIRIQSQVLCAESSTPESACSYELDHGISCSLDGMIRWFYRKSTDSCSAFDYNGCGGNPNSFSEQELCERTCVRSDLCQFQPCAPGVQCVKNVTEDSVTRVCIAKGAPYPCTRLSNCSLDCVYGRSRDGDGCEVCRCNHPCDTVTCSKKAICSVGVIFASEPPTEVLGYVGECIFTENEVEHESASANLMAQPDAPIVSLPDPSGCKMDLDIGFRCVTAPVLRWYYMELFNNCSQFDYQGCGGNGNNFVDRETCDRTCRMNFKEQCKVNACPEGLECEMIDMSLLCPVETPCPGMTTIRCVAPTRIQKTFCTLHSGISSDYALAVVDMSRQVKYVVVRQMSSPTDNPDAHFLWYEDSQGTLRSKSDKCISDDIPMQLVKCEASNQVRWFYDSELNVIRTEKGDDDKVKAIAVIEHLAESEQKISIPKHLVVTEEYLRSVGQQTHEATWTMECN